jgi:ABC-type Fe3+-hydroxamate transport system substrate-binding protein
MKRSRIIPFAALLIAGLMSAAAAQAQALSDAARACLKVADDTQRLACFDREIGRLVAHGGTAASAAPAAVASAPASARPANVPTADPSADFGVKGSAVARKQDEGKPQIDNLDATVTNVSTRPHGERVVTLDNGQVWVELSAAAYFPVKAGDKISIQAGSLNSYRLQLKGRSTLVRRVQ